MPALWHCCYYYHYLLADSADAERHELDCDIFELPGVLLVV